MKKDGKIRSNFVKESLLDYNNLANTLKENTESAVRDLLKETVLEQYAKILTEDDDKDDEYDVEEVEDTDSENTNDDNEEVNDTDDGMDSVEAESGSMGDGNGGWSEFEKYKVSDDKYDFSNAEDEEIVKVYKLLKDDDQVVVVKNDDKVNIKDNETGAEYIIDLGSDDVASDMPDDEGTTDFELEVDDTDDDYDVDDDSIDNDVDDDGLTDDIDDDVDDDGLPDDMDDDIDDDGIDDDVDDDEGEFDEDNFENQDDEDMNESRIFEIALNEYNSNVGYTDNYQNKDVMTNPGMSEPGKNVNDWDKGVPKDSKKPWSGKKGNKSENQPFTAEKGRTVEEEEAIDDAATEAIQELKTRQEHTANVGSTSRTDGDNGNRRRKGRSFHTAQYGQETTTLDNPYSTNESIVNKANKIFNENRKLKNALMKFRGTLEEAAVTNVNLGNIIKLVMENATTKDEKKEIIARFGNEAKSVEASQNLYENLSRDLKRKSKMNIDEGREYGVGSKQINETQIYRSNDILNSLDLMHRICK